PSESSFNNCDGSQGDDGDFPDLTAFLSQDEINRSLDLAREAFSDAEDQGGPVSPISRTPEPALRYLPSLAPLNTTEYLTKSPSFPNSVKVTSSQSVHLSRPVQATCDATASPEKFVCHRNITPVYKQDRPRLVHDGLELNERAASATEFCSRAATFIEELSSIFKGSNRLEQQGEEDSSSPDSGYLSPKSHRTATQGPSSAPPPPQPGLGTRPACMTGGLGLTGIPPPNEAGVPVVSRHVSEGELMGEQQHGGAQKVDGELCLPHFTQKLKSQEVAEGHPIRLECRVEGNPLPVARWFCEGRELHNCPDIQIWRDGDLHTLVIAEAFEDDTGRYTCVASNCLGADNTSAEVYIEGGCLTSRTSLGSPLNQVQKKTTSISLSIHSPSTKSPEVLPHRSALVQPLSAPPHRVGHVLQDAQASEGQVVVLECRVRGCPPPQVTWSRQGQVIQDSPDFRILQKSERFSAEEICTLVISEAFPEDGGQFCCTASNRYGSVSSTAQLFVTGGAFNTHTGELQNYCFNYHLINKHFVVQNACVSCPSRNSEQLKQLQDQILLEQQEAASWIQQQEQEVPSPQPQEVPSPPSPPLPPPPSFQELESSAMQTSTFNYARPKQFIAAQSPGGTGPVGGYVTQSSGSSGSSLTSPLSPPTSHKPFTRVTMPAFSKGSSVESHSPSSPSFPPPPPPFLSNQSMSSPAGHSQDFPPPPPPPPPPCSSVLSYSPAHSNSSSPFTSMPQSPAGYLASVLPATPTSPSVNALGLPKGNGTINAFPRKQSRGTPRLASDSDIQGSKDAVIQDLERKLRFKEERMSNGQQRLTYEEKMARRLLGADNAATVLNTQQQDEEPITQEYKVSSFEQRLISEIEFRLERSPVEESDEDVQHDEDATGQGGAPFFQTKLKHYKVFEGMPVTFSCKVIGDPKPKIYWFKDGKQISKRSEHYRISRDADGTCHLHTAAASLDDDGNYTVMAGNPEGRVSCTGRMMVQAVNQRGRSQRSTPGHIRRPRSRSRDSGDENENIQERHFRPHFLQAPGDLIVQEGKLCRMDCKVSGLPTPDLIWQLNGQTIRPDSAHKMLVRENGVHSLVIEPVSNRDAGIYTCIASNRAGQNSFNLELIVAAKEMHKAPSFIEKLQNTGVAEGYPVRLECRVSAVPYPQIFWKKENESFTHNTDRISMHQDNCGYLCMIIQPAMKEDAGWYTVSAKNEAGIVSSTARLDVHTQWQQPHTPKPKKVRPSASRYAALTERGLDVKAAFFPDSSPLQPGGLVESDDL
uniref:Palladin n=1 Tax=Esox lucius TaxID=8010 RepID=A0A3P8XKX5_ESOLU